MAPPKLGVAVVGGTDASDWGYGNLVWIDGHRAEEQLRFTAIERSKPINWRELLGIIRIVETWGASLEGQTLLIESDNMCAVQTSGNMKSKAEDMQELVRRLLHVCEVYGIHLRVTHTPGEKLHRPANVWMHPAHHTVASALQLLSERMRDSRQLGLDGTIVVPWDEDAAWWSMTKHFVFEGGLALGCPMEENRLGVRTASRSGAASRASTSAIGAARARTSCARC